MQLTLLVGNPRPLSRTLTVATAVGQAIVAGLPGGADGGVIDVSVIDLADFAGRLFDWEDKEVAGLNQVVAGSEVVVVASPTYKATYTGLLKAFLDRYGSNGLSAVTAVPVMVGAAPIHALAPEVSLRPLLVELGASVPSRGLYVLESQLEHLDAVVGTWAEAAVPLIAKMAAS